MVKSLKLNCIMHDGSMSPVTFFIGNPAKDSHPIKFQADWLQNQFGASVSEDIMDSLKKLHEVAEKNRIEFEDLCERVFDEVNTIKTINSESKRIRQNLTHIQQTDRLSQNNENNE